MENRIQINGTWYVKEDTIDTQPEKLKFDAALATHFEGYVYETTDYCWEATRIYRDGDMGFYEGVDIKFTNKSTKEEDYWDNNEWMKNVVHEHEEALREAHRGMDAEGVAVFRLFLSFLMYQGWLK